MSPGKIVHVDFSFSNMYEFCPLCLKNGMKIRIKSFQLNFEEAVFMCATDQCTWPVGYEDITIMYRPIGKEWSKTWDETASKYLKNDHQLMLDFATYTPPQTPNHKTIPKNISNNHSTCTTSVYDVGLRSICISQKEDLQESNKFCSTLTSQSEPSVNNLGNLINLKPKVVVSKTVNYTLEKLPTQGYTFKNSMNNTKVLLESTKVVNDCKNILNISTSLTSDSTDNKDSGLDNSLSTVDIIKRKSKLGLKLFSNKLKRKSCYEKFDFSKLMKQKSTNVEKVNESDTDMAQLINENGAVESDKLHSNNSLNLQSINRNSKSNHFDSNNVNTMEFDSRDNLQIDFNSILGLSNSSKDSGVDQDLTEKEDFDLHLDELLSVFSNEINSPVKNNVNNTEEYEWMNSLFE